MPSDHQRCVDRGGSLRRPCLPLLHDAGGARRREPLPVNPIHQQAGQTAERKAVASRDAEAAAATAAAGPEQVSILLRISVDRMALWIDDIDREQAVAGQPERPRKIAIAAAKGVTGYADRRAATGGKCQVMRPDGLVDCAERRACPDCHGLSRLIDADCINQAGVDDDAFALRKTLKGMPAAAQCKR